MNIVHCVESATANNSNIDNHRVCVKKHQLRSVNTIKKLARSRIKYEMSSVECIICFELMTQECILMYLDCGHVFHQTCVNQWCRNANSCPECRVATTTAPHRLYLQFTENAELKTLRAQENSMNEKLQVSEATANSMKDTIQTLQIELEEEKEKCRAALTQATKEKEEKESEKENFQQKLDTAIAATQAELKAMKASKEEMEQKVMHLQFENSYLTLTKNAALIQATKEKEEKESEKERFQQILDTTIVDVKLAMQAELKALKASKEEMERRVMHLQFENSHVSFIENARLKLDIARLKKERDNTEFKLSKIGNVETFISQIWRTQFVLGLFLFCALLVRGFFILAL